MTGGPAPCTGREPDFRHPEEPDRRRFEAMWDRCSAATRLGRLHSPCPQLPFSYLQTVLEDPDGTVIAVNGEQMVGIASLFPTGAGRGELAALVEDSWQGCGIGARLVGRLVAEAPRRQITVITASVLADRPWVARAIRRVVAGHYRVAIDGPTLEVTVELVIGSQGSAVEPGAGTEAASFCNRVLTLR